MPLAPTRAFDCWLASEDHIAQLSQSELRNSSEIFASRIPISRHLQMSNAQKASNKISYICKQYLGNQKRIGYVRNVGS